MIPLRYGFLLGDSVSLFIWMALFVFRKDLRREMLGMSVLVALLSVITGYYWWTIDWWHPLTITGTRVGLEDLLIGFSSGGTMAVVYEELFGRKLRNSKKQSPHSLLLVLVLLASITSVLVWGIGLTSFWASTLAMVSVTSFIWYLRRDLVVNSLWSGVFMVIISFSFYVPILALSPGWVLATYDFQHLSGVMPFGVPIEEFVFWFLAGLIFGPLYEYWQGKQLINTVFKNKK